MIVSVVIWIVAIAFIVYAFKQMKGCKSESLPVKPLDKVGRVFNIILSVLYVPLSLFSWLLAMASEATIDATNQLFITLINVFCGITMTIPLLCVVGIMWSVLLRKKGYSVISFVVQFLPLVIFILNVCFLFYIETIPTVI